MMNARLVRSRTDVMLGGVCGGLGRYLGIDPLLVRLFFVVLTLASGSGIWIYVLLWIIIPREDAVSGQDFSKPGEFGDRINSVGQEFGEAFRRRDPNTVRFIGIAFVLAGLIFLVENLHLPWLAWLRGDLVWPAL